MKTKKERKKLILPDFIIQCSNSDKLKISPKFKIQNNNVINFNLKQKKQNNTKIK